MYVAERPWSRSLFIRNIFWLQSERMYMHINLKIILDPYSQQLSMGNKLNAINRRVHVKSLRAGSTKDYLWDRFNVITDADSWFLLAFLCFSSFRYTNMSTVVSYQLSLASRYGISQKVDCVNRFAEVTEIRAEWHISDGRLITMWRYRYTGRLLNALFKSW